MNKTKALVYTLFLFSLCNVSYAWNWSGVLKSKTQVDNRNPEDSEFFSKVWGSVEVFDNKSWHGGLDFVTRLSDGKRDFDGDIYQLYVQKEFKEHGLTIKGGRFQRADSLGYYAVDGVNYQYEEYDEDGKNGYSVQFYTGIPRRLEDVRSVSGDWLYGLEGQWNRNIAWKSEHITLDDVFFRGGFQQFADEDVSTRLNLASTITGQFPKKYLQSYELSIMGTYEIDTSTFEDFMVNAMLDITEDIRVRTSYELYHPRDPYITFREKFYSEYSFGRQDLLRVSVNNQINDYFEFHFGFKRARRSDGNAIGYGGNGGMTWDYVRDLSLAFEIDYLELGEEKSENLYLSTEYTVNADLKTGLNVALANNKKRLYGNNESVGVEVNTQYRIYNTLFLKLSGSHIWYSAIENEYLGAIQLTWYLDRFIPKATR
ncbi:MAG: hypothetical protein KAH20_04195 [Methylococcales bacterium]|nr:hypothetical protein [Methylococcales bacterium]